MDKKIIFIIKQEAVLTVAVILAIISLFLVHPDKAYIGYIDFRTLGILFSLMTVMAGLRRQGVFDRMGHVLLANTGGVFQLVLVLVGLCFFSSMFITNDVALLTFVPFTFVVLKGMPHLQNKLLIPLVCMQTIAANLGSSLTPIGNPQNLYLYAKGNIGIAQFVLIMLPYTALSLILLVVWAIILCRKSKMCVSHVFVSDNNSQDYSKKIVAVYEALFVICVLSVIRIIPWQMSFGIVLLCVLFMDRFTMKTVDYSLIFTFVAFFIFIGNLGRIDILSNWLRSIIDGREVFVSVFASQITSNVPAALLLSGFTDNIKALIIGTNIGGLGTLIASMASLISYRQIAREFPEKKGKYFVMFTVSNIIFLVILMILFVIIR